MSYLAKIKTHQQTLFYRELDLVLLVQKVEPGRTHIVISDSTATPPFANIVISVSTVIYPSGNIVISVSTVTPANITSGTRQGCTI